MGRISAFTALLFISGIWHSNHCAHGQSTNFGNLAEVAWTFDTTTEAGAVLGTSDDCPSFVQSGLDFCSSLVGVGDLVDLLATPGFNVCSNSFQQYSCAQLENVTTNTTFNILNCALTNQHAIITQGAFSLFFSKLNMDTIGYILNRINREVSSTSLTAQLKNFFLNGVWERLRQDPQNLTPGALAVWIQEKLYMFIPAISPDILNCISTTTVSCDGLEAIVNGLDLQYSSFSNESRAAIGMWITRFINSHSCQKDTLANSIKFFYKSFQADMNLADLQLAFPNQDWSSVLSILSEVQVQQYVETTKAFESYASASVVLNLLSTESFAYNYAFLNSLPSSSYSTDVMYSLLNNLLDKLNSIEDPLCKPQVKAIFQGNLSFLLTAANETTLQKFAPKDCSDFQDFYQGFDEVYDELSAELKQLVFQYRSKFLQDEADRSGSGCTYGVNSTEWLGKNYGRSVEFATYAELISLNKNFDGYQAILYLNVNQTIDLLLQTGIFTSASPSDIQIRVTAVTRALTVKGYVYLMLFLTELRTILIKLDIKTIVNFQVRYLFLEGTWGIMKTQFSQFQSNDWYSLTESLSYFISAISTDQLTDLSYGVVKDCSNMKTIVGGLGSAYGDMNSNSTSEVTDWISNLLRADTSHCISGEGNWLVDNYAEFRQYVSIATIKEINPSYSLVDNIAIFTSNQLGEFVIQEPEAHTDVALVERVFEILTNGTHEQNVENLANFWDGFIAEYPTAENFTNEVKHIMLYSTVSELSSSFETFTSADTTLWFETRMYPVMTVIDSEVLSEIPVDVSCGFQISFVKAVSSISDEILDSSRNDVVDYIQRYLSNDKQNRTEDESCTKQENSTVLYIQNYFGNYSVSMSYAELKSYDTNFDVFELGVFPILTNDQFGDMIVQEDVYESEEKVTQVFEYLSTQTVVTVDAVMTRFSETGYKKNIQITNVTVGQKILENYFNIIKTEVKTYTTVQIKQLLKMKVPIIIQFFTEQTLSNFAVRDCDTNAVIVAELNKGFSQMSESTKSDITSWILSNLKSPSLNGCTSSYTTTAEWVDNCFKEFFKYTSLKEVQTIYTQLDTLTIITQTSVSQKVEYLCTSNALTNVTVTSIVLESLKGQDNVTSAQKVVTFLDEFNTAYGQLNIKTMTTEVREVAMTFLFPPYINGFNSLTVGEISMFPERFSYIIGGITSELIQEIPLNINCDSYKSIFGGISSAYDQFSSEVKEAVFGMMISYLDYHETSSSDVCSSLYTDSRSYIKVIFQNFSRDATIYEFAHYYSKFDAYSCLDVFSGTQLGNLLINTTAIKSQMDAVQILVELKKRGYKEVYSFMTELERVAKEKNITKLPDSNVQDSTWETVMPKVWPYLITTNDYKEWYGGKLDLVISSCSVEQIAAISVDIDCASERYVVKCFGNVYDELDDDKRSAVYKRIKHYNQGVKDSTGNACPTESGTSSEWIREFVGEFKYQASLADFQAANSNFSAVSALNECTGSQVADYAIQSGALRDEEAIIPVLVSIGSPNKVQDFLDQCNSAAPEELQNSPVGNLILGKIFEVLKSVINGFQSTDWQEWTQVTLKNILHNINETELEIIHYPLTCASYQQLLIGLNNVYDIMKEESRKAVYNKCIKPQFNSVVATAGIKCGQQKGNIAFWVQTNFAKFSVYIMISEYMKWNIEYKAINVISTLSPDQLADVAVDAVTDEKVASQVAATLQEFDVNGVNDFLDKLSLTLNERNIKSMTNVVGSKFLSASLTVISGSLSSYSSGQWEDLIAAKLQLLIFSIDSQQLTTLLDSADCNAYKIILNQLNSNFDNFEADTRQSLFQALYNHITNTNAASGFCPQNIGDNSTTITNTIGKFSSYLTYSQFIAIDHNFNLLSAVNILSPSQLANVSLNENVFADQDKANALNGRLEQFSFQDTDSFLRSFQATVQEKEIGAIPSGSIRQSIFTTVFNKVSTQFASMSISQLNEYFGSLFSWFLPSLQVSQVDQIPETISCAAFQSVVSGCSKYYGQLQADVQIAMYNKIKSFLAKSISANGVSCPSLGGSGVWLVTNFREFRALASISDFYYFNPDFIATDAVSYLSPSQLGTYVANNEVLSDKVKIDKVLSVLNSQNIGLFLDAFNAACATNGITTINNIVVKKNLMGEIFCKAESGFPTFNAANYSDFLQNKLKMFLSSLDARAFGFIPTDISCDSLAAIMKPLFNVTNPENPTAVFDFVESVLLKQQASTGVACMEGNLGTRPWISKYLGKYIQAGSWPSIRKLYPNFDLTDCTDLLSSAQLAAASAETTVIHNVTIITIVMATVSDDINSLFIFIDTLRIYVALDPSLLTNANVKEVVLTAVAHTVLSHFDTLPVADIDSWMTKISFLLPSFNETILEYIPVTIDCVKLQTFVAHMDTVFSSLTKVRMQVVARFIKSVLKYQAEQNGDPCTDNTQTTPAWIQKNIASYCSLLTADDMKIIYPDLNEVSYNNFCGLTPQT